MAELLRRTQVEGRGWLHQEEPKGDDGGVKLRKDLTG